MSSITIAMVPSHSTSVLMGGYACADKAAFVGRTRGTTIEQLPGTRFWRHAT